MKRSPLCLRSFQLQTSLNRWYRTGVTIIAINLLILLTTGCGNPDDSPTATPPPEVTNEADSSPSVSEGNADNLGTKEPNPASSPQGDPSAQPSEAVKTEILEAIATDIGISSAEITITDISPETWSDGCLGLGQEGEFCTMALVDGWQIEVTDGEQSIIYRSNATGTFIRREGTLE